MGDGFQFLDVIIIGAFAAFLILRLRGVLGKRTGHQQRPQFDPFRQKKQDEAGQDKVVPLPDRKANADPTDQADEPMGRDADAGDVPSSDFPASDAEGEIPGLMQIKLADQSFDPDGFVNGAKIAFEMVIASFARGDTRSLRPLLSNDVYDDFAGAIKTREEANETLETTLVGFSNADLIEAELQGKTAFVTIKFVTEQVNVTRDAAGKAVDGDESNVTSITDIWTFARNTRSRDPNWTLVATRSPN